jgi:hypothetical protein
MGRKDAGHPARAQISRWQVSSMQTDATTPMQQPRGPRRAAAGCGDGLERGVLRVGARGLETEQATRRVSDILAPGQQQLLLVGAELFLQLAVGPRDIHERQQRNDAICLARHPELPEPAFHVHWSPPRRYRLARILTWVRGTAASAAGATRTGVLQVSRGA